MFALGERRPVLCELILMVLAFLAAAAFTAAGSLLNLSADLSSSVGRILAGAVLLLIFRRAFRGEGPLRGLAFVLPALLFAVWNLGYNLSSGARLGGSALYIQALITALAPALFEEVLFRGIFLYNLEKKGLGSFACLFISAALFAAVHLTNLAGQNLAAVALQLGYSFVIGLVLGAIYLKNHSLVQVAAVHFLIDFTNRIYPEPASSANTVQLAVFVAVLLAEAVYSLWLTRRTGSGTDRAPAR